VAEAPEVVVREREGNPELDDGVEEGVLLQLVHVVLVVALRKQGRDGEEGDTCARAGDNGGSRRGREGGECFVSLSSRVAASAGDSYSPPVIAMPVPRKTTEVIMFTRNL
jgi:hypothetical protein